MNSASSNTGLPTHHKSTTSNGTFDDANAPLDTEDSRGTRPRLSAEVLGQATADASDMDVQWSSARRTSSKTSTSQSDSVVYRCFDFCPSPADHRRSRHETRFRGPIRQHMPERPPVSGVLRIIIAEPGPDPAYTLRGLTDDAGVYFKLPASFFLPCLEFLVLEGQVSSVGDAYTEALILRTSRQPLLVQAVDLPGSESADMTCIFVLFNEPLCIDLLSSLTAYQPDSEGMLRDSICAIARLWVQELHVKLHSAIIHHKKNADAILSNKYAADVFETMAELENGDSNIIRWLLIQDFHGRDLDTSPQYQLYRTEHQRLLDETRRIIQQMQLRASLLSIEESTRGIEQSKQVGRLTQLAFVFIPLTFVTGVFGMNITQFGGEAPLWKFWVTAGTISGIAFVIGLMTVWFEIWLTVRYDWWPPFLETLDRMIMWKIRRLRTWWSEF